jgi:MFS superfamily sulfate permease-like transporter
LILKSVDAPWLSRRLFIGLITLCVGFACWIVFLGFHLPTTYRADNWDTAWIGFDSAMLLALIATTITAYFRHPIAITLAIVTSTLMFTDAWFDVMTSQSGNEQLQANLAAIVIEIPLAIAFATFSHRRIKAALRHKIVVKNPDSQPD